MSKSQVQLAEILLKDHYGELVAKVGTFLFTNGSSPLQLIALRTQLTIGQIKQSLHVLIQHNFCTFSSDDKGLVEFYANVNDILLLARFPWYMHAAKSLYGDIGELIVEEILTNADVCQNPEEVKEVFSRLSETQFIRRCPEIVEDTVDSTVTTVPTFKEPRDPFLLPNAISIRKNESTVGTSANQHQSKKRPLDESSDPDSAILWRVNYDKFHLYFRDQFILRTVGCLIDDKAVEVMRAFLRLNEIRSNPDHPVSLTLSYNEAVKLIPESVGLHAANIEQYVALLREDSSQMFRKAGESAGGLYVVDFSTVTRLFSRNSIEDLVREKLGSKALRLFRVLLSKNYLEQNELERLAMLPSKEGKELTYKLLCEGFISIKEVPKTTDFAPSRTFYLFHVDLPKVVRKIIQECYHALSNLILRREHEYEENKALLERQERLEAVVANIQRDTNMDEETKRQHIADVEEAYISVAEKEIIAKYRKTVAKIQQAEIELDQNLLTYQLYLKYIPPPVVATKKRQKATVVVLD